MFRRNSGRPYNLSTSPSGKAAKPTARQSLKQASIGSSDFLTRPWTTRTS